MAETAYIVLRQHRADGHWEPLGDVDAHSSTEAVRKKALSLGDDTTQLGTFVAVPKRSWSPLAVRAEQQTVLKLEEPVAPVEAS
jgi:hypothetical protein